MGLAGPCLTAGPVQAQLSPGIGLATDYRLRGYSLSRGRPVASVHLAYDDASGLFLDGATMAVATEHEGIRWLGAVATIGYAVRLDSRLSIDAGVMRAQYSGYSSLTREAGYTEVFAGISGRGLSAHVSVSPDYFLPGVVTAYGRIDAVHRFGDSGWRAFGRAGALTRLSSKAAFRGDATQYDWQAGIRRQLGPLSADLSLSGGGPSWDYYDGGPHSRTALMGALRLDF